MATPFIGEIRPFGFTFAPQGWAVCAGQLLAIVQNEALFSLIGTTYGGDGQQTFALPDLRGRVPVHPGSNVFIGQTGGVENVTLAATQLPAHSHPVMASADLAATDTPAAGVMGAKPRFGVDVYAPAANLTPLSPSAVDTLGANSQPHDNMQPGLVLNFCIALEGIYPSRS